MWRGAGGFKSTDFPVYSDCFVFFLHPSKIRRTKKEGRKERREGGERACSATRVPTVRRPRRRRGRDRQEFHFPANRYLVNRGTNEEPTESPFPTSLSWTCEADLNWEEMNRSRNRPSSKRFAQICFKKPVCRPCRCAVFRTSKEEIFCVSIHSTYSRLMLRRG